MKGRTWLQQFRDLDIGRRVDLLASMAQITLSAFGLIVSVFFLQAAHALTESQVALQHRVFLQNENERAKQALADAIEAFNLAQYGKPPSPDCFPRPSSGGLQSRRER
jgi:hypothetical protein